MTVNANTFESGQTGGTAITPANSGGGAGRAWDSVVGTVTYDLTRAHSGMRSAKVAMAGGTTSQLRWTDGADQAATTGYLRFYIWLTSLPSQNLSVAYFTDHGNLFLMRVRIRSNGTIDLIDQNTQIMGTTTAAVATGQWVRIEARVTCSATAGQGQVRLYNTADSTAPTEDLTTTAVWNTGATRPGAWRFGGLTSTAAPDVFWLDDVATSDAGWLGPAPTVAVVNQWTLQYGYLDEQLVMNPTPGNWLVAVVTARVVDGSAPILNLSDVHRNMWVLLSDDTGFAHADHADAQLQAEVWACPVAHYDGWPWLLAIASAMQMTAMDVGSVAVVVAEIAGMGNGWLTVDSITPATATAATTLTLTAPAPAAECLTVAVAGTDVYYTSYTATGDGWAELTPLNDFGPDVSCMAAVRVADTGGSVTFDPATGAQNWAGVIVSIRVSGLMPPQPNPNWPLARFEVGLGYDLGTPLPWVHWTDQTPRLLSLDGDRGIQAELGTVQQGTADLAINNRDGAYQQRDVAEAAAAVAAGTTTTILIADADATSIHVADFFRLQTSVGDLKELTVFHVAELVSAAGVTTITFTRADGTGGALAATEAGDIYAGIEIDLYIPWRQTMTWAGKTHVWASGWLRDLPIVYTDAAWSQVNAQSGDPIETLTADAPTPLAGEILRRAGLYAYWPCDDIAGAGYASNASGVSVSVLQQTQSKYGVGAEEQADFGAPTQVQTLDSPKIVTTLFGDSGSAWAQSGGTAAEIATKGWALVGTDPGFPPLSGGVTIFGTMLCPGDDVILNADSDPTVLIVRTANPDPGANPGSMIRLSIGRTVGVDAFLPTVAVWDKVTHAATVTVCGPYQIAGEQWKTWALSFSQSSWSMYLDGALAGSGACNLPEHWTIIGVGGEADPFFHGRFFSATHGRIAVYSRRLTAGEIAAMNSAAFTGTLSKATPATQLATALNATGWRQPRVITTSPALAAPAADTGGSVGDLATTNAASEDSMVFADAASQLQYRGRVIAYQQRSRVVLGERTDLGEVPYQPGMSPSFNPVYVYSAVRTENTRIGGFPGNYIDPLATSSYVATDDTSARRYTLRSLRITTRYASDSDAWHLGWWTLSRYARARQRVERVTIEAAAAPDRWPLVLSIEIGDLVTVRKRQLGQQPLSFDARVIRVQPADTFGEGGQVTGSVTLTLAAAPPPVPITGDPEAGVLADRVMGA